MNVAVVFGTRPEAIKLAPVVLALRAIPGTVCHLCGTGQHRELLDGAWEAFGLRADADLGVMRPDQTLAGLTARLMEGLDDYLARLAPELVLVQGDTTTALCGALAAFYRRIPVGHVEAGLRTGNLQAPWPEEANRVLTTRLAALHFAPTAAARANLLQEGVAADRIAVTGNPVIDALRLVAGRVRAEPQWIPGLPAALQPGRRAPAGQETNGEPGRLVLITGHRRENFGSGFEAICRAIAELALRHPAVHFVYPVHLNPNVREPVERALRPAGSATAAGGNVHLIEPLPYVPFVALMDAAEVILTDSGGIQEEAPSLGKTVVVMRETTERPEALATGRVHLVGTDARRIVELVSASLATPGQAPRGAWHPSPYGDGFAAERIAALCRECLRPARGHEAG